MEVRQEVVQPPEVFEVMVIMNKNSPFGFNHFIEKLK
jgi:hypothetical protein